MSTNDCSASQELIEPTNSISLSQQSELDTNSRNNFENDAEIHFVSVSNQNWNERDLPYTG